MGEYVSQPFSKLERDPERPRPLDSLARDSSQPLENSKPGRALMDQLGDEDDYANGLMPKGAWLTNRGRRRLGQLPHLRPGLVN